MGESMGPALFKRFCDLARDQAGISLHEGKEELVKARVARRLRAIPLSSAEDYLDYLENDSTGEEMVHFLDAISTNFTSFWREPDHLDYLAEALREWANGGQRRFRMWSAASSTGEEPWSIAMTTEHTLAGLNADWALLATDISTRALTAAKRGIYAASRVQPLPVDLRRKFLSPVDDPGPGDEEAQFSVDPALRKRVKYARLNLAKPPVPMRGPMDVIFCRNVFIYFDTPVRQGLVSEFERLLRPGGVLCIGHTETLTGIRCSLRLVRPSVFRKAGGEETS